MSTARERKIVRERVARWRRKHATRLRNLARSRASKQWPEKPGRKPEHRLWRAPDGALVVGTRPTGTVLAVGSLSEMRRLRRFWRVLGL